MNPVRPDRCYDYDLAVEAVMNYELEQSLIRKLEV